MASAEDKAVDPRRVRRLNSIDITDGPVLYWMWRDQRVQDNWALLYARQIAAERRRPLAVAFVVPPTCGGMTLRHYDFMLGGLEQLEDSLKRLNIPMFVSIGDPVEELPRLFADVPPGLLVTDSMPLRQVMHWKERLVDEASFAIHEVDAHNIVPVWEASDKLEYAAYTIRPKIQRLLPDYLTDLPAMKKHPFNWTVKYDAVNWSSIRRQLSADGAVRPVDWIKPGEKEARKAMSRFFAERFSAYHDHRNDPNRDAQSGLSPYLHFGQLSAQCVALEAQRYDQHIASQESFLEELIVRRELVDNFCFYQPEYDSVAGFPKWAQETLAAHRSDPRRYRYSPGQLEAGETHDPLWNAAQQSLVVSGKLHGYLRMYWAKKILEWTGSPEEALAIALRLNDRYSLDGNDPNGFTGVAWSIGAVHDRPWSEREVFGKVRYMSFDGCKRKFDVAAYIALINRQQTELSI